MRTHGRHRQGRFRRAGGLSRLSASIGYHSQRLRPVGAGVSLRQIQRDAGASGQFFRSRSDRDIRLAGRSDQQQRQRLSQFSLRIHSPACRWHCKWCPYGWPHSERHARRQGGFPYVRSFRCPTPPSTRPDTICSLIFDWIDLFIGSEGTLGVVTEAEIRLLPVPSGIAGGRRLF